MPGPGSGTLADRIPLPSVPSAVFMVDLNGFKEFNDARCHLAGDAVLQEVASLLPRFSGPTGLVARYGGDEFGMLVGLDVQPPEQIGQLIQQTVAHHTFTGDHRLDAPSVGYAVYPGEAWTARQPVALADTRMYRQKIPRR